MKLLIDYTVLLQEMIKDLVLKAGKKSPAYTSVRHTIFDRLLAVSFHIGKERSNFDVHKMCEHVQLC